MLLGNFVHKLNLFIIIIVIRIKNPYTKLLLIGTIDVTAIQCKNLFVT